jgi:rod shape determining protein RodA
VRWRRALGVAVVVNSQMLERRLYFHIDWLLIAAIGALCAIGLAMIFSTTGGATRLYWTQSYAVIIGLVAMVAAMAIDYRSLADKSHIFYIGLILALVAVMLFGSKQMGAQRWIDIGLFNLQPSEFAKAIIALVLAKLLGDSRRHALTNNELFLAVVLTAIPLLLIIRQPDLGTAVTLLPILLVVTFAAGLPLKYLGVLAVVGLLTAPVAWRYALEDYQKERIETFLDPEQDPRGAGYQQIQARITTGSGGIWGKGFRQGTQGQLRFLPVAHNDFIFSVLAEEQGFVGVIVVLSLYLFVIMRALEAAKLSKDRLGAYVVLGVLATFTFQVIYNITMSAGLAPVKGLTLPLMSYGGSSMIATLAGFGLILNVRMRRFTN